MRHGSADLVEDRYGHLYDTLLEQFANYRILPMTSVYYRLANPATQTISTAKRQIRSGEIWGYEHRGGDFPSVKAYIGPLPETREGVEFRTAVPHDKHTPNNLAMWRLPEHGGHEDVQKRTMNGLRTAACVQARVDRSRYSCKDGSAVYDRDATSNEKERA